MTFFDEMLVKIDDISPAQFLWIYVGVWVVLLLLGYFLAGGILCIDDRFDVDCQRDCCV